MSNYEILGIGNPIVDLVIPVSDQFLKQLSGAKGGLTEVNQEELLSLVKQAGEPLMVVGGSASNTIKGLAHLGHKCALAGKIGTDHQASQILQKHRELDIVSCYQSSQYPTAQVVCLVSPDGERTFFFYAGATQEMSNKSLDPELFKGVRLVHIEGYSLINPDLTQQAMLLAKEAGAKISFDLGSFIIVNRYKNEMINLISNAVDILFANQQEAFALTGLGPEAGCTFLKNLGPTTVVFAGRNGCYVGDKSPVFHSSTQPVKPLDSSGAGDFFASGFIHGYLAKKSLETCARYGALLGAAVVQTYGTDLSPEEWKRIKSQL
jgi:sugar/nucleoside kinase (ribokinase family)